MSKELAIVNGAVVMNTIADITAWCENMVNSDLVPNECRGKVSNAVARVLYGMEIGLSPTQSLQSICVINGKPSIWGDALPALCRASGKVEFIEEFMEGDGDKLCAVFRTKRVGQPNTHEVRFSAADAKAAGLWEKPGPWKQYKPRMLKMRARSFGLRDVYPDVLKGIITAEEAIDYQDDPGVRQAEVVLPEDKPTSEKPPSGMVEAKPQSEALQSLLESDVPGYWEPTQAVWKEAVKLTKRNLEKTDADADGWLGMANVLCEACGMGQDAATAHMEEQHGYGIGDVAIPAPYAKNLTIKCATLFITIADLLKRWGQLEKEGKVEKNTSLKLLREIHVRLQTDMAPDLIGVDKLFFEQIENALDEDPATALTVWP